MKARAKHENSIRAAEPTTKTASGSIERRDCTRSYLVYTIQIVNLKTFYPILETPARAHIHAHRTLQLSYMLVHFPIQAAVLAGFHIAAQGKDAPVLGRIPVIIH